MDKKFIPSVTRLFTIQSAAVCGVVLTALLITTGCSTTTEDENSAALAAAAKPAHAEIIILREGDTVRISFPGSPNLDTTQQIRRDGKIQMSLVGEVDAAGLTPDALQDKLIKLYAPQIASKEINVSVLSSSFPVYVTGAVIHPGKIMSDHPITALGAIMESGGFDVNVANLKAVRIIRNESGVMKTHIVNLKEILDGKNVEPFYLKPEDIIYVTERLQIF